MLDQKTIKTFWQQWKDWNIAKFQFQNGTVVPVKISANHSNIHCTFVEPIRVDGLEQIEEFN